MGLAYPLKEGNFLSAEFLGQPILRFPLDPASHPTMSSTSAAGPVMSALPAQMPMDCGSDLAEACIRIAAYRLKPHLFPANTLKLLRTRIAKRQV